MKKPIKKEIKSPLANAVKLRDMEVMLKEQQEENRMTATDLKRHRAILANICLTLGIKPNINYGVVSDFDFTDFIKIPNLIARDMGKLEEYKDAVSSELKFLRTMVAVAMEDPMVSALADKVSGVRKGMFNPDSSNLFKPNN